MKQVLARYGRGIAGAAFCIAALCLAAVLYHGIDRKVKNADGLAGKWVGRVIWNDASGKPYQETLRTALFFLPGGVVGTVISFPTGAIGGAGHYVLKDGHLSVRCTSLSVNGRSLPMSTWAHEPWFHDTANYTVSSDGTHLTLTPDAEPTPAPCWPLLVSPKPIVLSRIAEPEPIPAAPAPRE